MLVRDLIDDAFRDAGLLARDTELAHQEVQLALDAVRSILLEHAPETSQLRLLGRFGVERFQLPRDGHIVSVDFEHACIVTRLAVVAAPFWPIAVLGTPTHWCMEVDGPDRFARVWPAPAAPCALRVTMTESPHVEMDSEVDGFPGALIALRLHLAGRLSAFYGFGDQVDRAAMAREMQPALRHIRIIAGGPEPEASYINLLLESKAQLVAQLYKLAA